MVSAQYNQPAVSRDVLSSADAVVVYRALCVHRQARLSEQGCAPADLGVSWASTVMPCDVAGAVFVHGRWSLSNVSWSQRCSRSEAAPCAQCGFVYINTSVCW